MLALLYTVRKNMPQLKLKMPRLYASCRYLSAKIHISCFGRPLAQGHKLKNWLEVVLMHSKGVSNDSKNDM
jgi:hypothetical protein